MLSCNVNDSNILAKIQFIAVALYGNKELQLMQMKNAKWTSNWNESEKEKDLKEKDLTQRNSTVLNFRVTLLTSCSNCQKIFKTKNHEQTPETKHYFFLKQSSCCSWFLTVWQCGISILQAFTIVFHLHPSAPSCLPPPPNKRHPWLGQLPTSSPPPHTYLTREVIVLSWMEKNACSL